MTRRTEQLKKFGGGATEKNRNIDGSRSTSSYHGGNPPPKHHD